MRAHQDIEGHSAALHRHSLGQADVTVAEGDAAARGATTCVRVWVWDGNHTLGFKKKIAS